MRSPRQIPLPPEQQAAYHDALAALGEAGVDFLVGGGFGMFLYLSQWRATKDLDVFLRPHSVPAAFDCLEKAGFACELTDPAWLAKAHRDGSPIDIIFCSYNGLFPVDDDWFAHARWAHLLDRAVRVVAPEEMILSKSFVAARDRFDGSDIAWLVRALGADLDWERIERHMEQHSLVLLWQIVHCLYVFPSVRAAIPAALVVRLLARFAREMGIPGEGDARVCRGPMLDPISYLAALSTDGMADPRPRADLVGC